MRCLRPLGETTANGSATAMGTSGSPIWLRQQRNGAP
jgi:hypothetical protein